MGQFLFLKECSDFKLVDQYFFSEKYRYTILAKKGRKRIYLKDASLKYVKGETFVVSNGEVQGITPPKKKLKYLGIQPTEKERYFHELSYSNVSIDGTEKYKWLRYYRDGYADIWYCPLSVFRKKEKSPPIIQSSAFAKPVKETYHVSLNASTSGLSYVPSGFLYKHNGLAENRSAEDRHAITFNILRERCNLIIESASVSADSIVKIFKNTDTIIDIVERYWKLHEIFWKFLRFPFFWLPEQLDGRVEEYLNLARSEQIYNRFLVDLVHEYEESFVDILMSFHNSKPPGGNISPSMNTLSSQIFVEEYLYDNGCIGITNPSINSKVIAMQFISYGVGCLFGRYAVEKDGLILADAGSTIDDFRAKIPTAYYCPVTDGILPLTDEDDFANDLPTAFKSWLRFISGVHYDDNLRWIEERLGKDLRNFFDRDFYKDHIKRYKSRPIYWMV